MQQQNKASAQSQSLPSVPLQPQKEWHASQIAAAEPTNSLIPRISGKQVYLKDKPQALILLQAAEIDRLTGYLNDYKCKYRSLSRDQLDRQSYEVQIKELFERDNANKIEIDRLTKTITVLTASGEQYKKQLLSAQEKNKSLTYEKGVIEDKNISLQKQLKMTRQSFDKFIQKSQAEIHSLNNQLSSHKTYTDSVLKNNSDLVARVNTIPTYERRIFQLQTQLAFYLEQSQRLNKDIQLKTEKLINQERGYSTLIQRHKHLESSHENLKNQLANNTLNLQQSKDTISQLQSETEKVKALHETSIRQTTLAIIKRTDEIEALTKQVKDYDQQVRKYSEILSKKETTINELTNANHDLQKALHASKGQLKLSQQIIKALQSENEKLRKLQQQLKSITAEKEGLNKVLKEKSSTISQLEKTLKQEKEKQAELIAKSSKLNDDHQELKKRFAEENISLNRMINNKVSESETLKKQLISNQIELRNQFEKNIEDQNKIYAEKIARIHEEKQAIADTHNGLKGVHDDLKLRHAEVSESKSKLEKEHSQIKKISEDLKAKTVELERQIKQNALKIGELLKAQELLKGQLQQKGRIIQKLQHQLSEKETSLQHSQNEIYKLKDELNKLRVETVKFKVQRSCYNMEIYQLNEDIEKLKSNISKLKQQTAQKESEIAKLTEERQQLSGMFQGKTKQNEGLKRKMIELQNELRDSFETALKEKEESHAKVFQKLTQQKDDLSKKVIEIEPHVIIASELKKQKETLEATLKNTSTNHDIEKTRNSTLTQQNEKLRKAIIDTQTKLKSYYQDELALKAKTSQQEIDRLSSQIEHITKEKSQLKAERDSLFAMSTEYQAKITLLIQEIDRLHTILNNNISQNKTDMELARATNSALQAQITSLSDKLQTSQKKEEEWSTKYTLLTKKIASYDLTLEHIRQEIISIQLMTGQLRQERDLLIKKNTVLVKSIRTLSDQLDNLQKQGDSIAAFFTKESSIHKELTSRFMTVQDLFNELEKQKIIVEEDTTEIVQMSSK